MFLASTDAGAMATAGQVAQMWEPFLPIVLANLKHLVEGR